MRDGERRPRGAGAAIYRKKTETWHARWRVDGKAVERKPKGRNTKHACVRLLERVEVLVAAGSGIEDAIREALGEPALQRPGQEAVTFAGLLDLYLHASQEAGEKKSSTLRTDGGRAAFRNEPWVNQCEPKQ